MIEEKGFFPKKRVYLIFFALLLGFSSSAFFYYKKHWQKKENQETEEVVKEENTQEEKKEISENQELKNMEEKQEQEQESAIENNNQGEEKKEGENGNQDPINGEDLGKKHWFVFPNGLGKKDGSSVENALSSIQQALNLVKPGEVISLGDGDYYEDLETKVHGKKESPIKIIGSDKAVLRGSGKIERIFQIFHDYYILDGFTINGHDGKGDSVKNYRDKLLYVQGRKASYNGQSRKGPTGLVIRNMDFLNAGGECIRLRYFVTYADIHNNNIKDCGKYDFVFKKGGKNGEGIYIGTSSEQWDDGKNPTSDPDASNYNHIHHNYINTNGNECVEVKEGGMYNIIEHNTCTGGKDKEAAGLASRGNNNIFRNNKIFGNVGCGLRFGGHKIENSRYGDMNDAYQNTIYENKYCGIKFMRKKQGKICENKFTGPNGEKQKDIVGGEYGEEYEDVVSDPCL